ncbi:MAG: ribosome maturation factor RimP [Deltaproteobacteria bacterium]|nr:MAG: ribosome maturation factor RimP [Deltaproteobacteria bacterium]
MQHHPIADAVEQALRPLLTQMGFDLVWVEFLPQNKILRLYIDHAGGISLDDCTAVSRRVSDMLDAEGASLGAEALGRYTLEVSSPGLDRPLMRPEHFNQFVGQEVSLQLHKDAEARRKYIGLLVQADDAGIRLRCDEGEHAFAYTAIGKARLVPQF